MGNSCKDAGGHFNPGKKNHGDVNAEERHEGDFGNIVADSQGIAKISVVRYKYIHLSNPAYEGHFFSSSENFFVVALPIGVK